MYTQCNVKEEEEMRRQTIGSFDIFQFVTSAMVASDFEGLRGYGTLEYEVVPI